MNQAKPISTENVDAILRFLPVFKAESFSPGHMMIETGAMPFYNFSKDVSAFMHTLYDNGWVIGFDWSHWHEGQRYFDDFAALGDADVETLRKLFTVLVRQDRFCEGFLASKFESGFVAALLMRLKQVREQIPAGR